MSRYGTGLLCMCRKALTATDGCPWVYGRICPQFERIRPDKEEPTDMARKPRSPKAKEGNPAVTGLLSALKFVEPVAKDVGNVNQTHCMMAGNWLVMFDGLLAMACKIDTDLTALVNTKQLIAALSRCDGPTQITQLDSNRLGIKAGRFSAFVPCLDPGLFGMLPPDPPAVAIDQRVIDALQIVGRIAKENAPRMVQASVLLRNGSAVATDGRICLEYWHGHPLPDAGLILPKVFVAELGKIAKKPKALGCSPTTCTIYYEDDSFIRTQLYTEQYPDVSTLLETPANPWPIPEKFFDAIDMLKPLRDSQSNRVYMDGKTLRTHDTEGVGASYELETPLPKAIYNIELLAHFKGLATKADFAAVAATNGVNMAMFYGDNFRGGLAAIRQADDDVIPY